MGEKRRIRKEMIRMDGEREEEGRNEMINRGDTNERWD